jgi:transcriptional regulator with XRE-family HTH domain
METTIAQRFERLITELKLNNNSFAKSIGVSATAISRVTNGENEPGFKMISNTLDVYPSVSSDWLIKGEGDMFKVESVLSTDSDSKLWERLFDRYEKTIEDLRYTISLQKQLLGKHRPAPVIPNASKVLLFTPTCLVQKIEG